MSILDNLFKKFWIQHKLENVQLEVTLPKTNLLNYNFYVGNQTRIYTIELYKNEDDTLTKIAQDNGSGVLVAEEDGILSSITGEESLVDYVDNLITIYWNPTYLSSLVNNPILYFKYVSDTRENHVELLDFLGEVFSEYKLEELDKRRLVYDYANIPLHQIDNFSRNLNWEIDRVFSEEEEYIRRQLKYLFNIYKSKRKLDGVYFAISIINRRVNFYNLLAKKGSYDDYSEYVIFDSESMFKEFEEATPGTEQDAIATDIQTIYNALYLPSSDYYPTKHFLLDVALDILTFDGNLLNDKDLFVLKNYILKIKSTTQFPHFQTYLGLEAGPEETQQSNVPFLFKLTAAEQTFYISEYRTLYTGPNQVSSMAQLKDGAWAILPLIMNTGYSMNSALKFNMGLGDVENYLTSFRIGKGSYVTLTDELGSLDDEFFTSENVEVIYDSDYYYITLTLDEDEGNDYPISEVGIFNDHDKLAFYIKHPKIYKINTHKHRYKLKLKVSGV